MEAHLGAVVNDDLVREIALLAWLNKSEAGEDMFRLITGARVMKQVYDRLSGQTMIDEMREQTVKRICVYCEQHPNASKEELATYVQAQIAEFALKAQGISTTDWGARFHQRREFPPRTEERGKTVESQFFTFFIKFSFPYSQENAWRMNYWRTDVPFSTSLLTT